MTVLANRGNLNRNAILIGRVDRIKDGFYHYIGRYCNADCFLMDSYHCDKWCYLLHLQKETHCPFLRYKFVLVSGFSECEFNTQEILSEVRIMYSRTAV